MSKYLGKTLTIVNPLIVDSETYIEELEGFSAILTEYDDDDDDDDDEYTELDLEYGLPTSDTWDFPFWSIPESSIECLLEQGAITIS